MVIFTREELFAFKIVQLRRLADYYQIDWLGLKKEHLVDALAAILSVPDPDPVPAAPVLEDGTPVSVRIKRIYEQNRGVE